MQNNAENQSPQYQSRRERIDVEGVLPPQYATRRERHIAEQGRPQYMQNREERITEGLREAAKYLIGSHGINVENTATLPDNISDININKHENTRSNDELSVEMRERSFNATAFLDLNELTLKGHIANHKKYPELPIFSLVDQDGTLLVNESRDVKPVTVDLTAQLSAQREVIESYRTQIEQHNFRVITYLDLMWKNMQEAKLHPNSQRSRFKEAAIVADNLNSNNSKRYTPSPVNAEFQSELEMAAMRQHWMNQRVAVRLRLQAEQAA